MTSKSVSVGCANWVYVVGYTLFEAQNDNHIEPDDFDGPNQIA